jgi:hypothetical protein
VPAAAVIPAPIAYIKVVAVKKLVVEGGARGAVRLAASTGRRVFLLARRVPFGGCAAWPGRLL